MANDERNLDGLSEPEEVLARRLAELGPLMGDLERAEAEIDPAFARTLRAHLVHGDELAPHPTFARNLRARLMRRRVRPVLKASRRRLPLWTGLSTATLVAVVVALLAVLLHQSHTVTPAFTVPYPTRAELIFSYPSPPISIHHLAPTVSEVHPAPGIPYAGHLQLTTGTLLAGPAELQAYRLTPPSNVVPIARTLLGIHAPVQRIVTKTEVWMATVDGGFPSHLPLHSLAVSLRTGELIYHDRRNALLPRARHPLDRADAVLAARIWLARLGWPGYRMPLRSFGNVASLRNVREVVLGWVGVGTAATEAATLWVTPNGSVIEAWVWPQVTQHTLVPARSASTAWVDVRTGTLPLAVEGVSPYKRASGAGSLLRTTVSWVLSLGREGTLYLAPTYRFEGRVHIPGASIHTWYALAPGTQKK